MPTFEWFRMMINHSVLYTLYLIWKTASGSKEETCIILSPLQLQRMVSGIDRLTESVLEKDNVAIIDEMVYLKILKAILSSPINYSFTCMNVP